MEESFAAGLTRRHVVAGVVAAPLAAFASEPGAELPPAFPTTDPADAREIVGVSHFNLDRVRELVTARPELAKASYDWGFGDWETALGAASHTGQRQIADVLIQHGARPDLFSAAMLGQLDVVRATIAARPGIQRQHGPHGITLLAHAQAGGEAAAAVVAYLRQVGDADVGYTDLPLSEEQRAPYEGIYTAGPAPADRFAITTDRGNLSIRRGEGTPRRLFHQGNHEFHPAGAPSVRIRFDGGAAKAMRILIPRGGPAIEALRVGT